MCKSPAQTEKVTECLKDNPNLLNCLGGLPFRNATIGGNQNLRMVEAFLENSSLKVDLTGEAFYYRSVNPSPR